MGRYLLTGMILVLTMSCGSSTIKVADSTQTVEVDDSTHTVVIDWNFQQFDDLYRAGCEEEFETEQEVQDCIDDKIDDFLNIVNGRLNRGEEI